MTLRHVRVAAARFEREHTVHSSDVRRLDEAMRERPIGVDMNASQSLTFERETRKITSTL